MPILALLASPIARYLGIALVIGLALFGIYHAGGTAERHKWEAAKLAQELEASAVKLKAEQQARTAEGNAFALGIRLEKERDDHAKKLAGLQADNRSLAADIGRMLRDTGSRPGGADGLPRAAAAASGDPGGAALGEFFRAIDALVTGSEGLTEEADGTALVGILCHGYTVGLPAAMATGGKDGRR